MQAFFWIALLTGKVRTPLPPPHYHLLVKETARIKYGVDHSTYVSTLAKDIGAAPGLWELWWEYGTHVFVCYWCALHPSSSGMTANMRFFFRTVSVRRSRRFTDSLARFARLLLPRLSRRKFGTPSRGEVS